MRQHSNKGRKTRTRASMSRTRTAPTPTPTAAATATIRDYNDRHCNQKALPSLSLVVQTHRNCLSLLDLAPAIFSSCFLGLPQLPIRWGREFLSRDSTQRTCMGQSVAWRTWIATQLLVCNPQLFRREFLDPVPVLCVVLQRIQPILAGELPWLAQPTVIDLYPVKMSPSILKELPQPCSMVE